MAISPIALSAYQNAMASASSIDGKVSRSLAKPAAAPGEGFGAKLMDSLKTVNDMQNQKSDMVESFASGQTQNVHELMINLQKAGLAMQMTTAVRGKVLEAYKELVKMQF
ncbi:flagellar hook-basal body complex protein FliE [Solidesulfovibrio sp.]|jgi:flagellar hook-basal body complex protein FliE|uniref:flagellar hook-basal body complex protein FliE n=1 Tax=Solidesulfovibrio sp. TaxID=2910990 RepID=UPI000EDAC2C2|nr:flagellar hook-basal body complex protein FliE [Solidesulfovibrio sp.]MEA5090282.1 flagellar hook-basal body complex protein FliE [Solidesulfovibrio sp.]HCR11826.1 flagellar hook-basal body complex protein FliE [Desulfovibrio sp.]HML60546.1 flagellar hook-basal body complex protein FliE [Solidesulfovibrio sp.]